MLWRRKGVAFVCGKLAVLAGCDDVDGQVPCEFTWELPSFGKLLQGRVDFLARLPMQVVDGKMNVIRRFRSRKLLGRRLVLFHASFPVALCCFINGLYVIFGDPEGQVAHAILRYFAAPH